MMSNGFKERLTLLQGGESLRGFARRIGVAGGCLRALKVSGNPTLETLLAVSRGAEVNVEWLAAGDGPMKAGDPVKAGESGVVPLPWLKAYRGRHHESEQNPREPLPFPRAILAGLRAGHGDLRVTTVTGDGMAPSFNPGDVALVDISFEDLNDDGVYAFFLREEVVIRRVQRRMNHGLVLISDNPNYPPEEVAPELYNDVDMAGRVVWHGRMVA